ncbi:MAG: hypothetical protein QOK21_1343 [Solirubrobacteraceae bacterium]|nr:hypothetical protein [Solirubrobacteraceae bacterium]
MTDPSHIDDALDGEEVDGLPVVAAPAELQTLPPGAVPARQAVALAATTFVAGAATAAVVTRRRARRVSRKRRRGGASLGEIVTSNSFLVDVHLLRRD